MSLMNDEYRIISRLITNFNYFNQKSNKYFFD